MSTDRFLSDWPSPFTPAAELVYEGPRRQQQLLDLSRRQLDAQRATTKVLANSTIQGAQIIANEIRQQSVALESQMASLGHDVSTAFYDAADQLQESIDRLGDRVCGYLGEIKWQLAQQASTLGGILHTLRESRSNEARQLDEQGVRHYVNDQYDRAEERFHEALKQDTTDYQVLLNLGFIEVRKGNDAIAKQYFHDALRLPAKLDVSAKSRALWALARLRERKSRHCRRGRTTVIAQEWSFAKKLMASFARLKV